MPNAIETRIESKNKKTPFSRWNITRLSSQTFSENPKIRVSGQDIDMRDYQNKNAVDCNIYEVLEKYNGDLKMTQAELNKKYVAISEELSEINNLADAHKLMDAGTKLWNGLPLDIRKEFNYSVGDFVKNGGKKLAVKIDQYNKMIAEQQAKYEAMAQPQTPSQTTEVKTETAVK